MVTWYWQDENFLFLSVLDVSIWLHKWVAQSANVAEQNLLSSLQLFAPQGSLALHKAAPHANSKVSSVFWLMVADIGAVSRGRWPRSSWKSHSCFLNGREGAACCICSMMDCFGRMAKELVADLMCHEILFVISTSTQTKKVGGEWDWGAGMLSNSNSNCRVHSAVLRMLNVWSPASLLSERG